MFQKYTDKLKPQAMWQHFKKSIRTPLGILYTVIFGVLGLYLLSRWREYGRGTNDGSSFYMYLFLLTVALGVLTYVRFMAVVTPEKKKCITIPGAVISSLFFGTLWYYTVEIIVNSKWRKISAEHVRMSIAICVAVFFFLFFLFHSLKAAVGIGSLFYLIFALAEYYTIEFRGIPVMFYDLLDIGAAAEVAGGYDFDITKQIVIMVYLLLFCFMNIQMQSDRTPGISLRSKIVTRVLAVVLACSVVFFIGHSKAFSKSVGRVGTPKRDFYNVGSQLCFIQTIKNAQIEPPEGYSVSELAGTAQPFIELAAKETGIEDVSDRPNIIAIMDESFADVDIFGDKGLAEEVMPNILALSENTVKGKVMVSTYGGGTGRSEFEFNTGSSMHLFAANASPYAMFGQRLNYALASQMKAEGYHTIAIHPFSRTNYNRQRTYAAMGFDEFLAKESFKGAETLRNYVSDKATFERICELTEETEEPLFTFCVTMQNHGGYKNKKFVPTYEYPDFPHASQFLSLIQATDEAVGEMIDYFGKSSEKTIIVFFGDHFPGLADSFYKDLNGITKDNADFETRQLYYQTPFFIWANYDIPEEENVLTSLNYLGMQTVELAGVRKTPFQLYLEDLKTQIPAFSGYAWCDTDGKLHEHDTDETVSKLLNTYDAFEYNLIIDKKNKLTEFFKLP